MSFKLNPVQMNIGQVQGRNPFSPVAPIQQVGPKTTNPFSDGSSYAGIGIKDGAVQTSNGQLGKSRAQMRQLAIA